MRSHDYIVHCDLVDYYSYTIMQKVILNNKNFRLSVNLILERCIHVVGQKQQLYFLDKDLN